MFKKAIDHSDKIVFYFDSYANMSPREEIGLNLILYPLRQHLFPILKIAIQFLLLPLEKPIGKNILEI